MQGLKKVGTILIVKLFLAVQFIYTQQTILLLRPRLAWDSHRSILVIPAWESMLKKL